MIALFELLGAGVSAFTARIIILKMQGKAKYFTRQLWWPVSLGIVAGMVGGLWSVFNKKVLMPSISGPVNISKVYPLPKVGLGAIFGLIGAAITSISITLLSNLFLVKRRVVFKEDFSYYIGDREAAALMWEGLIGKGMILKFNQ